VNKLNIIMILIDGARIDRVQKSKSFQELMKKGTFFSKMITASPYTLASLHAIFTGLYGSKNGVNGYYKLDKLRDNCKTITEYLKGNGYHTIGDQIRLSLLPKRGFDEYYEYHEEKEDLLTRHKNIIDSTVEKTGEKSPFFLFLHCGLIHTEYIRNVFKKYDDFSSEYFNDLKKNSQNYDSYFNKVELYSIEIFHYIEEMSLLDNTIIIFLSDHGMGIGEKKGERAYGVYTYDYSIRTFALFIQPKIFPMGMDINDLTETIDIMPTLMNVLNIPEDKDYLQIMGRSLMPAIDEIQNFSLLSFARPNKKKFTYSETGGLNGPWPSPNAPNVKCIRSEKWKLIHNLTPDTWELYNIISDSKEENNLYEKHQRIALKFKEKLRHIEEKCQIST